MAKMLARMHSPERDLEPILQVGAPTANSFTVRYAKACSKCQNKIEALQYKSAQNRKRKLDELAEKRRQLDKLRSQIAALPACACRHEERTVMRLVETTVSSFTFEKQVSDGETVRVFIECASCAKRKDLETEIASIDIRAVEWLLPHDENISQDEFCSGIAFELCKPLPTFLLLRQALVYYLQLTREINPGREFAYEETHGGQLYPWRDPGVAASSPQTFAVGLGSEYKPFERSHYASRKVKVASITNDKLVTLACPMNCIFTFHQSSELVLMERQREYWEQRFALRLPTSNAPSYPQAWLIGVTHTQNQVLAVAESLDMPLIPLPMLIAFGSLRAGSRLQWRNLIRYMEQDLLNFNDRAVLTLVLQAIHQESQDAHKEVQERDAQLASAVLERCTTLLEEIAPNWSKTIALRVVVSICVRLGELNQDLARVLVPRALTRCQQVARAWVNQLREYGDVETRRSAAVCGFLATGEHTALSDYLFFLTEIFDCQTLQQRDANHSSDARKDRLACVQHALQMQAHVRARCSGSTAELTKFVQNKLDISPSLPLRIQWQPCLNATHELGHWMEGISLDTGKHHEFAPRSFQIDLRHGEFLVNGMCIKYLPRTIARCARVRRLFNGRTLERKECVALARTGGEKARIACYELCKKIDGARYRLQWDEAGGREDTVQILRLREKDASAVWELLLPVHLFANLLPSRLALGCHPWFDEQANVVQFETRTRDDEQASVALLNVREGIVQDAVRRKLLLPQSAVFEQVYQGAGLNRLEADKRMVLIWSNAEEDGLMIELVRFGLSFEWTNLAHSTQAVLRSLDWPGYCVKRNQTLGALTGLKQYLLLEDESFPKNLARNDVIIIPFGPIDVKRKHILLPAAQEEEEEADVFVPRQPISAGMEMPRYFDYEVDKLRFRELSPPQRDLLSHLFLAQLFVITSLPMLEEHVTGESGLETALRILQSARCWSKSWTQAEAQILHDLYALCPKRSFYPPQFCKMEETIWNLDLPVSPELDQLAMVVKSLLSPTALGQSKSEVLRVSALGRSRCFLRQQVEGNCAAARPVSWFEQDYHSATFAFLFELQHVTRGKAWPKSFSLIEALEKVLSDTEGENVGESFALNQPTWLRLEECCIALFHQVMDVRIDFAAVFARICTTVAATMTAAREWEEELLLDHQSAVLRAFALLLANRAHFSTWQPIPHTLELLPRLSNDNNDHYEFRSVVDDERIPAYFAKHYLPVVYNYWTRSPELQISFPLIMDLASAQALDAAVGCLIWNWEQRNAFWAHVQRVEDEMDVLQTRTLLCPLHKQVEQSNGERVALDFSKPGKGGDDDIAPPPAALDSVVVAPPNTLLPTAPSEGSSSVAEHLVHNVLLSEYIDGCEGIGEELKRSLQTSLLEAEQWQALRSAAEAAQGTDCTQQRDWCVRIMDAHEKKCTAWRAQFPAPSLVDELKELAGIGPRRHPRDVLMATPNSDAIRCWEEFDFVRRCARLAFAGNVSALKRELDEKRSCGKRCFEIEAWHLLELEMDMRIRRKQADIAMRMIQSSNSDAAALGENEMFQLNMGEGKTSVLLPMLAVALGRPGKTICRIIVLSALEATNRRDLRHVLGACLNRRVYSFPFTRDCAPEPSALERDLKECLACGGVILATPEHVLSLQLNAQSNSSHPLGKVVEWMQRHCNDVLDECDEILHPKFQLVYTLGTSKQESSMRWAVSFCALHVVRMHASELHAHFPNAVELVWRRHHSASNEVVLGLRLTENEAHEMENAEAWEEICRLVMDAIFGRRVEAAVCAALPLPQQPKAMSWARVFCLNADYSHAPAAETELKASTQVWEMLLVLRGLLACEVLRTALSKRWKVHYGNGPHPKRLAVPYRAKDVPSPRSDFAHPDMCILLSILHYSYAYVDLETFTLCLQHLVQRDDAERQFARWTKHVSFAALNLKDERLIASLHAELANSPAYVTEFLLSFIVFPKDIKTYESKISASPWDLAPPPQQQATTTQRRRRRVIGFSGSVDSKLIYPAGTNQLLTDTSSGMVVLNLLCNNAAGERVYYLDAGFSCKDFFPVLRATNSLILLDVAALMGANITNEAFARMWLEADARKTACVFPHDLDGSFMVITRKNAVLGRAELLAHSPYATRLQDAFVFLDQFRTRGVDLKFDASANAVVTVSKNTTRDACCQGAMRMRLLGNKGSEGQRVHFLLSPECGDASSITTPRQVLAFCLKQTQREIRDATSHWEAQGRTYCLRGQGDACSLLPERETNDLESMYAESRRKERVRDVLWREAKRTLSDSSLAVWERLLGTRLDRLLPTFSRLTSLASVDMGAEEEREMESERVVEKFEERRIQRGVARRPRRCSVTETARLLSQGQTNGLDAERHLLECALNKTAVSAAVSSPRALRFNATNRLFATKDFIATVEQGSSSGGMDPFVRQVEWIAVSRDADEEEFEYTALSPCEANALLPNFARLCPDRDNVALLCFAARIRANQATSALYQDVRLALPCGTWIARAVAHAPIWLDLAIFNGQLFFANEEQEKELTARFAQSSAGREEVSAFMKMRWGGTVGNSFVGSDMERWLHQY